MSFAVTLYSFSKMSNSTKQPSGGTTYNCIIKGDMSIIKPVISLDLGLTNPPSELNYAFIPTFGRYYYVSNWSFSDALWYAELSVDVMASYRSTIGGTNSYILRSSSDYDLDIPDNMYTAKTETITWRAPIPNSAWNTSSLDSGRFVVGISGEHTTYYIFTLSSLNNFLEYLFSDEYLNDLIGSWSTIFPQAKVQANPLQYITSIQWFPYPLSGTQRAAIRVGYVYVIANVQELPTNNLISWEQTITLVEHPQSSRGNYLKSAPYSTYNLFFPPWGMVQLNPDALANATILTIKWSIDCRTGTGTLSIYKGTGEGQLLTWLHSQVSVNYQVSQVLNSGVGLSSLVPQLVSVATGNSIGVITGTIGALGDAIKGMIPSVSTLGSNGGVNALIGTPTMLYEFKTIVDEDLSHRGRPLCQNRRINTLSGYVLVADSHMSIVGATMEEQNMIDSILEGGFYYE